MKTDKKGPFQGAPKGGPSGSDSSAHLENTKVLE